MDYCTTHEARMSWLRVRLHKGANLGQPDYRLDLDDTYRIRIFRDFSAPKFWVMVVHDPEESKVLRDMGFFWKVNGQREAQRFESRESALRWVAIRWDWIIDRSLAR